MTMLGRKQSPRKTSTGRKGTATVELAVCLPMLIAIFLAAIQAADIIFLKQTVCVAGYEAARSAIKHKSSNAEATAAGEAVMKARMIQSYNITFSPSDVSKVARGEYVNVTIDVPTSANTVLPSVLQMKKNLSVTTVMVKE
jgi:Flp pilus assembly protein TadG